MNDNVISKVAAIASMVEQGITYIDMKIELSGQLKVVEMGINDYITSMLKEMYKDSKYSFEVKSFIMIVLNSSNQEKYDFILLGILSYLNDLKLKHKNKSLKELFQDKNVIKNIQEELIDQQMVRLLNCCIKDILNNFFK